MSDHCPDPTCYVAMPHRHYTATEMARECACDDDCACCDRAEKAEARAAAAEAREQNARYETRWLAEMIVATGHATPNIEGWLWTARASVKSLNELLAEAESARDAALASEARAKGGAERMAALATEQRDILTEWAGDHCGCDTATCRETCLPARTRAVLARWLPTAPAPKEEKP